MSRETLNNLSRLIPGTAERTRAGSKLVEAYEDLIIVHYLSRDDVVSQPMAQQDITIEAYGAYIKDLALDVTDKVTRFTDYNQYGPGPHYFKVGSGYWYVIPEQRLVQQTWRKNLLGLYRPDFKNAPDATARDWYIHGMQVADRLISSFTKAHQQLPRSLGNVLNPKK